MTSSPAPGAAPASRGLLTLLLLPVLAYVGGMAVSVRRQGMVTFQHLDLVVFCAVLAYLIGVLCAAARRQWAVNLARGVGVAAVLLLGADLIVRWFAPPAPGSQPHVAGTVQSATVAEGLPGLSGEHYTFTVNALGLRGPDTRLEDAAVRILCVGGGTTECRYVPDEQSWPWALQDQLAVRLGRPVFVGNAGAGGLNTLHHAHQLLHYELVPQFQWVVVLCGFTDLEIEDRYDTPEGIAADALTANVKNKAFYRTLALAQLPYHKRQLCDAPGDFLPDPAAHWVTTERAARRRHLQKNVLREPVANLSEHLSFYRGRLKRIVAIGRAKGVKLVLLTQPALYRADLPADLEALLWMYKPEVGAGTPAYYAKMLAAYNQVLREVCKEEEVDCVDLAALLPRDTSVFYDDCHFNLKGCAKVAAILADFFAARLSTASRPN